MTEVTDEFELPTLRAKAIPMEIERTADAPRLEQVRGPGAPQEYQILGEAVIIGRSQDADIRVESPHLSRRHLQVVERRGEYVCEDLESRNGVLLNGVRIETAVLRDGDSIQMGSVVFIYHERR